MLWVKENVCYLQLHVYICSASKQRVSISRTVPVALFCKVNIQLHLKIKILIRRVFTAMPQGLLASALCLICLYHAEPMNPTPTCIKEPNLLWHFKPAPGDSSLTSLAQAPARTFDHQHIRQNHPAAHSPWVKHRNVPHQQLRSKTELNRRGPTPLCSSQSSLMFTAF